MSLLDGTIVNIALPSILERLRRQPRLRPAGAHGLHDCLAIVIPVSGYLGDRVGMKRLYISRWCCFTLSSALCGLAWNLPSLIAFRAIQGLGGGIYSRWAWRSSSR